MKHIIIILLLLVGAASATTFECENCSDCSAKVQIASIGDTVVLTSDILNCSGTCIDFDGTDGIMFDGGGNLISGDSEYDGYGIYLSKYSNGNVIRNCNITKFRSGIYMIHVADNRIHNTTSSRNCGEGITMLYSTNNVVEDCILEDNPHYDFYFVPYMLCDCDNVLQNVTGSGDLPVGFYNETIQINDTEFSALYLCSADNSEIENVTITGSPIKDNNGLRIFSTYGVTLSNITSSDNFEGISMYHSSNVHISNSEFNDSHHYNIFISDGGYNGVRNTTVCGSPQAGIYLYHTHAANLENITAMYNAQGILFDNSNYTTLRRSTITYNYLRGLGGFDSYDSLVYDNYFDNVADVTGTIHGLWNVTAVGGTNILNGSSIGGNYWSDYNGTDADDNGFGDTPWKIDTGFDYLPLFKPRVYLCGDLDDNGYVSSHDVIEAYKKAVDPEYTLINECVADIDCNGYISANDVVEIYRCAVDPSYHLNCSC